MNWKARILILSSVLLGLSGVLWRASIGHGSSTTVTYSQFLEKVGSGQIAGVVVMDSSSGAVQAICRLKDGNAIRTVLPSNYKDALIAMQEKRVDVEIQDSSSAPSRLLMNAIPFLLLLGFWIFLMFRNGRIAV